MSKQCADLMPLLPDYLDGNLGSRKKIHIEKHLQNCPDCRKALALQQEWLQRREVLLHTDCPEPSGNLNGRIMAAIRTEPVTASRPITSAGRWTRFMPRLAGAAAAVILLFAAARIYQGLGETASSATKADGKGMFEPAHTTAQPAFQEKSSREIQNGNAIDLAIDSASGWQVFNGSLQSLDQAKCLFSAKAQATSESGDHALPDILKQASVVRFLTTAGPPAKTLILAAYPPDQVDSRFILVKQALTTCTDPLKIEIIKADDLTARLNGLGASLFSRVFDQTPAESSWIFILIGE